MARSNNASTAGIVLVIVYGTLVLLPFAWIVSIAFKTQISILMGQVIFTPVWTNFEELLFGKSSKFLPSLKNSIVVSVISTGFVLAISSMAVFTLFRLRVGRWVQFFLFTWAMIFHILPPITFIGIWFVQLLSMGLFDTLAGLILAETVLHLPLALWLMYSFIHEIPEELLESGRLDGCRDADLFRQIVLPLMRPAMIAAGVLVFIFIWNDFIVAANLTSSNTQTVPVTISSYAQEYDIRFGEMAAGSVLSIIPALIFVLVGQKYIIRGLLSGSLK
ncbi:carbohydrate ABC transporter permease [Hoeflea poritis]|uniref:Carbohydrate ABC transporter permease n=1 Tax=Hoeflea poritis TaxID=2993659 RepID=A0ABT4VV00_9HYPH|nr:carbohydrate ABC transporter permease [Hoeflea poritis]MDA4847808.1 carbohydrate ABC transporter permease [Hoeflea poritis]